MNTVHEEEMQRLALRQVEATEYLAREQHTANLIAMLAEVLVDNTATVVEQIKERLGLK